MVLWEKQKRGKKEALITLLFLGLSSHALADVPSDELIRALSQHESGNNDQAIGDKHLPKSRRAYGRLQIRQCAVDDVNARYRTNHNAKDCLGDSELSFWICRRYINMYATEKRIGRKPTMEDMARIWNGGPDGWKKESTVKYWCKVRKHLGR